MALSDTSEDTSDITLQSTEDAAPQADSSEAQALFSARLADAEKRADEAQEAYLRARADFANFKRRNDEEKEALRALLTSDMLGRLLPVADNFERALQAAEQTQDFEKLIGGVRGVYRLLTDFLSKEGIEAINALNQPFDPNFHNAVARDEDSEEPENTIVAELQKGYTLNGKVLRPTLVRVAVGGGGE